MRCLSAVEVGWAAELACLYEAGVAKPGNVTPRDAFEDTCHADYVASAAAIGPVFRRAGSLTVGELIMQAVHATGRVVGCNTNLGIVLLLAPLATAAACSAVPPAGLREAVEGVLAQLTVDDAKSAYEAIRAARPAALGHVESHDVDREEVTVTLREAMAAAAERDSVAREYASGYEITFAIGVPALRAALEDGCGLADAVVLAFLQILARVPDTLIGRKRGADAARWVSGRANEVLRAGGPLSAEGLCALRTLDRELRVDGHSLNPGTTADLVCASLFAMFVEDAAREPCRWPDPA